MHSQPGIGAFRVARQVSEVPPRAVGVSVCFGLVYALLYLLKCYAAVVPPRSEVVDPRDPGPFLIYGSLVLARTRMDLAKVDPLRC